MTKIMDVIIDNYLEFNHFNLSFNDNKIYTVIGSNNSGKEALFKIISGIIPNNYVKCMNLSPITTYRNDYIKSIGVAFSLTDNSFIYKSVYEEMKYPLYNLGFKKVQVDKQIKEILNIFNLDYLIDKKICDLNTVEKQLLLITIALLHKPKVLLLDHTLDLFNKDDLRKINRILKRIVTENNLTIINFTYKLDSLACSDEIIIMNNYKIIKKIKYSEINDNDKLFYDNDLEIPFINDLNIKLKTYGLLNKNYASFLDMVNNIWE